MRILITNHHLNQLRGSELYTYTLGKELARRGHEVFVYTKEQGGVSERMKEFATVVKFPDVSPDLALINHGTCFLDFMRYREPDRANEKSIVIFTSHGLASGLERPMNGADAYVAISEEVADMLELSVNYATMTLRSIPVIRNGIDLQRFYPRWKINEHPKKALFLSNYSEGTLLRKVCEQMKIEFEHVGGVGGAQGECSTWNIEEKINEADLVFSVGRGALEAMACGRNVIIYDERSYGPANQFDGIVTPSRLSILRKRNLSGRVLQLEANESSIRNEILKYDPNLGMELREYVERENDICKVVDNYLSIYENCRNHKSA